MEIGENKGVRGGGRMLLGTLLGIAAAVGAAAPGQAQIGTSMSSAEKLRRLDIMLMVTGLRCRKTTEDFQPDYGRFTSNHLSELNAANADLRSELHAQGFENPVRALDQMSVTMANEYGNGHPWLDCAQLKQVAQGLADARGKDTLIEAAGQLLERQPVPLLALARR